MHIDITSVPEGRSSVRKTVTDFEDGVGWPRFVDGLDCRYDIDRLPHELTIAVAFSGRVVLQCARCLRDFETPVKGSCCVLARAAEDDEPAGFTDDDTLEYVYDSESQTVDMGQVVFDEVMTALPMKPLCRADCQGIEVERAGGSDEGDPRWDALRKLKERNAKS